MNKGMIMLMAAALALLSARGQTVEFTGWEEPYRPYVKHLSDNQSSLNKVFVVYDAQGVGMKYTAITDEPVKWLDFKDNPIDSIIHEGRVTRLPQVKADMGYKIVEGNSTHTHYYWVVDYANYPLEITSLSFSSESPCDLVTLSIEGQGADIPYYEVDGERRVLDRKIKLTYQTLEWNDTLLWQPKDVVKTFETLQNKVDIEPPLCSTVFEVSGDAFHEYWNIPCQSAKSLSSYEPQAVSCGSTVEYYTADSILNSIPGRTLSAPVHILFKGHPVGPVAYRVWQLATDPSFEDIIDRNFQDEWDYVFNNAGTYYMRFMVTTEDYDHYCEAYGDTYTIMVAESWMPEPWECPNVFSPGSTPEVNDIWKMPNKSMAEFHCWIFNRWGNLVYEYTDPDGGWDGKYKGKLVDTGVYYYVVEAIGTDGVPWKRRGDISILTYKRGTSTSGTGTLGY